MATSPATGMDSPAGMPKDGILLAEELLDLAERAQAYTNAAGVAVALRQDQELVVRTSTGAAPEVGNLIPISDGFIAECLRIQRPLCCRDTESDNRIGPTFRALKIRSLIAIPVCEHREAKGIMIVIAPLPNAFQPTHTAILMTLSDIIASKLAAREAMADTPVVQPAPSPATAAEPAQKPALAQTPRATPAVQKPAASAHVQAPVALRDNKPSPTAPVPKAPEPETPFYEPPKPFVTHAAATTPAASASTGSTVAPSLLRSVSLAKSQEKISPAKPEPGLLSPSEDPGHFSSDRAILLSARSESRADLAALASWELPSPPRAGKGLSRLGMAAAAMVLVIGAGFWVYGGTTRDVAPPPAPTPVAAEVTLAPTPVAATTAAPVMKTASAVQPIATTEQSKAVKPPESKPAEPKAAEAKAAEPKAADAKAAEAKHQPAAPVLEIAAAQPKLKPEPEADMAAPNLSLAGNDAAVSTLSKVSVAVPTRPQSQVVPATIISRVNPVYPQMAKQLGIYGKVTMHVTIASDGSVRAVRVISGPPQLHAAAVSAVKQWRYSPAKLDGNNVESSAEVQINFLR